MTRTIEEIKQDRRRTLAQQCSQETTRRLTRCADERHAAEEMHDAAYNYFYRKTCERIVECQIGDALSVTVRDLDTLSRTVTLFVKLTFPGHKPIGFVYDASFSLTRFALINKSVDLQTVADHYLFSDLLIMAEV